MAPRVDSLRESSTRVVRLVALGHLADAAGARDRLAAAQDDEALHDFRVALRRLRSWERAFRPYTRRDVSRKLRGKLRDLARDTGASRDLEVHIAWLAAQRGSLTRRQRPGLTWLLATLDRRKAEADAVLERDVERRFSRLRSRLEKSLASYSEQLQLRDGGRPRRPEPFAIALAPIVREQAAELRKHLSRVRSVDDQEEGHEARIAAKRLRYLLEPIVKLVPGAAAVVDRLKSLQDTLGDLHDAQVFGVEIDELAAARAKEAKRNSPDADDAPPAVDAGDIVPSTATESPEPETPSAPASGSVAEEPVAGPRGVAADADSVQRDAPLPEARTEVAEPAAADAKPRPAPDPSLGLAIISQRLRDRADAAYAQFVVEWSGERADAFFLDVEAVAARIDDAARADVEIERKYLLRRVPDEARDGRRIDIDQGYVPGERLHERVRRVSARSAPGQEEVRFYRTVKLGEGIARTEIEEETTAEIFDAMWPLTKGHRLRKRRYAVESNGRTWEIDEFRNRELVLAEIELDSEDEAVTLPGWLARAVVREVTTEPEYLNINLAR